MKHVTNEQYWKAVEYRSIISGIFTLLQTILLIILVARG